MTALHQSTTTGLAYRDEGGGRPIVLVHGWGVSGALFEDQLRGLSHRFRVIAPDLPGHGGSGPFSADASFYDLADAVTGLVTELRLGPVLVVGWSLGAMVAWDLLRRQLRVSVAGLVTIDMVPHLLNEPGWPHGLRGATDARALLRDIPAMRADWHAYAALFVPRIFAAETAARRPDLLARVTEAARGNKADSMANIWLRMADQDFRAVLTSIDVPALVVAGARSDLYDVAASRWVASQMPRGRCEVFERSGHAPHLEEPGRFNEKVSAFADELDFTQAQNTGAPETAVGQTY